MNDIKTELISDMFLTRDVETIAPTPLPNFSNNTRILDIYNIIPNPLNREIDIEKVKSLALSIQRAGAIKQFPIVVSNDDGTYMLISGHHRVAAAKLLVEKGLDEFKHLRCIIDKKDEIQNELDLIDTNLEVNGLSNYDMMIAIGRKEELLRHLQKLGKTNGKLRDLIATQSGLGTTQIQKYLSIYKKASPRLRSLLKIDAVGLDDAYKIVQSNDQDLALTKKHDRKKGPQKECDLFFKNTEEYVQSKLQTKVTITNKKIMIDYCSVSDLNRILDLLNLLQES